MRHTGLKLRMVVVGTILFGFYALLAGAALTIFGKGVLPLVVLGTIAFVGFQYVVGRKLALWSVGAEDMPEDRFGSVHRSVERLSEDMGIDKPRLMVADMGAPNAFAIGRKGNGVVVVSTELLSLLTHEELEGVLAHELAHIRNRDVVLMVLGQSIAAMVGIAVQWTIILAGDNDIADFVLGMIAGTLSQLLVMLFVLAISRYREYVADSDAAAEVGGEPLASALEKLGSRSGGDAGVSDNVSALCISGGSRGLLAGLFATHPPMEKRIERLRA